MSKQKNKSDFKAKSMAEMQERGVLVVEILASAGFINIGTKTGDTGKLNILFLSLALSESYDQFDCRCCNEAGVIS